MVKNLPSVERSTKIRFGKHVPDSNDQEENTIVFNASNVSVPTPYSNAVYLSPIRNRPDFTEPQVVLLMYDKNTKEITESGESANALVGGVNLGLAVQRSNIASNVVTFLSGAYYDTSFVTDSNVGLSNFFPQHTVSVGSNLYIDDFGSNVLVVSGNVSVLKDMIIEGNLTVNGDTSIIYTENTSIKDAFVELGRDNTSGDTTLDLGILMHRPDALSNVVVGYREGTDEFAIAYTDAQPTDKTFTPKTDEDINVHVYGLTHVDANIYAHEDVLVTGNVYVSTNVSVTKELTVTGNVYADKDLELAGNAYVTGNVVASKDLTLTGNAYVSGNVNVTKELTVTGNVYADKDFELTGNAYVSGNVVASKDLTLTGNAYVTGNVVASKDLTLAGNAYVSGNVNVTKQLSVTGNAYVSGNVEVTKSLIVSANTHLKGPNVFITNTMNFLNKKTAIVTDQVSNVQIRLGQLENVSNLASNPRTNQVLRYINNEWSNDYPQQNFTRVKNGYSIAEGRTLYKGNTVYVSATQNAGLVQVRAAQSHVASQMPCIGLVYEDIPPEGEGVILTYGILNNLKTTHLTAGGTVYVSNIYSGYHTSVKPDDDVAASPDLIQNLGICTRSHQSSGAIFVTGIGRANDIPNAELITDYNNMKYVYVNDSNNDLKKITSANLNIPLTTAVSSSSNSAANAVTLRGLSITSGGGFHGDIVATGNVTVDTNTFKVDAEANRVGILTASPGQTLDVRGAANVGALTTTSASVTDTTHSTSKDTGVLIVTNGGLGVEANIHSTNVFAASHIAVGTSATTKALDVRGTSNVGIFTTPDATVTDSTAATSKTTGALKVTGGVGIQGDIHATHANLEDVEADSVTVTDATEATSTTTGALQVTGGVGIQKDLYARDGHFSTDVSVGSLSGSYLPYADNGNKILKDSLISMEEGGVVKIAANVEIVGNITVTGNTFNVTANDITITDRIIDIANNNPSHELDIGILMEHPGYNIGIIHHGTHPHHLSFGYTAEGPGTDHVDWKTDSHITANVWGHLITQNTVTVEYNDVYIVGGGLGIGIGDRTGDNKPDANIHVVGNVHVTSNISTASNVLITGDAAATSKTTGALQVTGGAGIQGDLYATNITASGTVRGATLTGTDVYGTIAGSNTAAVSDLTATGTVKGATLTGTNLYGTIAGSNTAAVSDLTATGTVKGATLTGTNLYGTIAGSNTAAVSDLTASGTVKGATLTGTNLYGTIAGSNTASVSDLTATGTVKGATLTGTNLYGTLSGSNTAAVSDLTATGTVRGATLTGTSVYGTIAGSNTATVSDLTATGTVRGATLTGTSVYGALSGSNTAAVSDLTASATVKGATLTGTNLYGTIAGSNTAAVSDLTASGTVKGATLTGTNLYGALSGSNTAAVSDLTATGTVRGATLTGTSVYGAITGSNTASVTTLTATGTTQSTDTTTGTLTVAGGISTQTNVHAANVYISGGLITNLGYGVTKKTYSYSGTIGNTEQPHINVCFTNESFNAKINAQLIEGDDEISTISFDCCGGNKSGTLSASDIQTGSIQVFGPASTNPWSSTVVTDKNTIAMKPSGAIDTSGEYHIFIEYITGKTAGAVANVVQDTTEKVVFGY